MTPVCLKEKHSRFTMINNVNNYVLIISDIFIHNRQFYIHIYAFDTLRQPMTIASAILYCSSYRKATEIVFEN